VKYALIERSRKEFKLRLMCRVLQVSVSGYHAWRQRAPSVRALADQRLMINLMQSYFDSGRTYGAPRVHRDLREQGIHVGKKRVARLMRARGLIARRRPRRGVATTESAHAEPIASNGLNRRFDVNGVAVNRVWVSDITYLPTRAGWLFLAVVLDLASRRVVGWAMRETLHAELALSALRMALAARQPAPGWLHHSDRGVHYACAEYRELVTAHGGHRSMSRRGNCWDNAVAESFFSTLEFELIERSDWRTRDEARLAVFRYIEAWYNPRRRHSTLGYVSPATYEARLQSAAA
jgi:transposase InsO family protein